jgi:hypothetical protein
VTKATIQDLGELHNQLARTATEQLKAVALALLKHERITADPESNADLLALNAQLKQRRANKRITPADLHAVADEIQRDMGFGSLQ